MKEVYVLACVLLLTAAVAAESPHSERAKTAAPHSIIVVKLNGLNCTTAAGTNMFDALSWSWGASNPVTFGVGLAAGKASVSSLNVLKRFDQCSPLLFGAVVVGKSLTDLTLTQEDSTGNPLLTVTMTKVFVESWQLSGSVSDQLPTESVSFAFQKVCIADTTTSTKSCFDVSANQTF